MIPITTFSIAAFDPGRQEWGVAVQSKFMAVGAVVSHARAGAGAVATQSYANMTYGPDGLTLMEEGLPASEVIKKLTTVDPEHAQRQVGLVDCRGEAAAFTGSGCHEWAGHIVGQGFCCQGNILLPGTVEAMGSAFEKARKGSGELADWLVAALAAGQEAGGDRRGRQSAAVLVVREGGGYGGNNDRYLDLRVDDHVTPIAELKRLVEMHHLFFGQVDPQTLQPLSEVAVELQAMLRRTGHYDGPDTGKFDLPTRVALRVLVGMENLEERWDGKGNKIDEGTLNYLRQKYG
jgi:uncharacterized Ntn-hydrolase superfamily protein